MAVADNMFERALSLASSGTERREAVEELLQCCEQRRLPAVLAKQRVHAQLQDDSRDAHLETAYGFLSDVVAQLPS